MTPTKKNKVQSTSIRLKSSGGDAGEVYEVTCPVCQEQISVALFGGWWSTHCSCGYNWTIDLIATGEK